MLEKSIHDYVREIDNDDDDDDEDNNDDDDGVYVEWGGERDRQTDRHVAEEDWKLKQTRL